MFRAYGSFPNSEGPLQRNNAMENIQTWSSGPVAPPPTPTPSPSTTSSSPDFQLASHQHKQHALQIMNNQQKNHNSHANHHNGHLQTPQLPIGTTLNNLLNNNNNNNSIFKSNNIKGNL